MDKVEFNKINSLTIGNLVQYNKGIYSIYDMDDILVYLNNSESNNVGIPYTKIKPVLITDSVMDACDFQIDSEPESVFSGDKLIQVKTNYVLKQNKLDIDFKITIIIDYTEPDPFLVKTFDKIDKGDRKIKYLHQVQNIFKHFYDFELIALE